MYMGICDSHAKPSEYRKREAVICDTELSCIDFIKVSFMCGKIIDLATN